LIPDNNIDPGTGAGFSTSQSTSTFSSQGVAFGGGLNYARGNFNLGFDYAYRNMGALGNELPELQPWMVERTSDLLVAYC
jgi:hypothetical protein